MTLPSSGVITLAQVNQELGRASPYNQTISLNDTVVRTLFRKPSGAISLSDGYGKQYITQQMIVDFVSANRWYLNSWCMTPSTDTNDRVGTNNPYARYVSSSSYTATFSNSGRSIGGNNFTVIVQYTGASPGTNSATINGTGISVVASYEVNVAFEQRATVYYCTGDWRTVTSVATTWAHASANAGSWVNVTIIPGKWNFSVATNIGGNAVSVTYSINPKTIVLYSVYNTGYNGNFFSMGNSGGATFLERKSWWYNHGGAGMVINANATANTSAIFVTASTDNYGNPSTYFRTNRIHLTALEAY
jgi:hypothetical protein